MRHTQVFTVGSWRINYLPKAEYIDYPIELERFLNKEWLFAVRKFPSEAPHHLWGGLQKFKIPSPIIRVELTPLPSGNIKDRIYSIGKRPGLLGTLAVIARQFPEHRKMISEGLSGYSFDGFIQMGKFVQDDQFVATNILQLPYYTDIPAENHEKYYWVRTDPHTEYPEELLQKLEAISLVPVRADGCNREFLSLGMAERVSEMSPKAFSWNASFVIKPVQETWGSGVEIYDLEDTQEERSAAKDRIENLMKIYGPQKLMIQPYIPDRVVVRGNEAYHEIWRLYFVYIDGGYTFTGGMAQGSLSKKVCGIDGTYFIPLLTH